MVIGGIDAGGTSTRCIILAEDGRELARVKTGPANFQVVGVEKAVTEIKKAVNLACEEANLEEIDLLGIGLAGAGREEDIWKISEKMFPLQGVKEIHLTNDGEIALLGAHGGEPGLVVIAGTGSIVYGLKENSETIRAGGWGPLLGDEGSGFWIGLKALQYVIKAEEGRAPETSLTRGVLTKLNFDHLKELISFVYQPSLPREKIAGLAPLVITEMKAGDKVASEIINSGISELAATVHFLAQELKDKEKPVATAGGLFNNDFYFQLFSKKLKKLGNYKIKAPKYEPVYGAILYACFKSCRKMGKEIIKG